MSDLVGIRDRARFSGPNMRAGVVERPRLDDRYASAAGRVLRVLAPAGYGKSTQVLRWVFFDERRVRWLDLEPIDNDPLVLAHVITSGLTGRPTDDSDSDTDTDTDTGRGAAPFDDLVRLIAEPDEPFVLVLDDIHNIVSEDSAGLIDLVIDHLPPHSTLILVGRAQHRSQSIARQRLEPGIIDITTDDLAFDLAETEELLTAMGVEHDIDTCTAIAEQFEGWPAGLRLAGQVMAMRRGGIDVPLGRLGDLTDVTDYVTQEWFGALGPDDQVFLTEVGCLKRFSGAQCDEVLGRRDSASTLRRLCHDELMLIGLDQHDEWYRMHAVLARWLAARLRNTDPERWRAIHLAAATWWSDQGDTDLAVKHAAAADDLDFLESLVLLQSAPYAARGMYQTLERWMEHFSESHIHASLPLKQIKAVLSMGRGDGEQALGWTRLCRADHVAIDHAPSSRSDVLAHHTAALYATLEVAPARELIPVAREARRHLPSGEWRALACLALGANLYLCGDGGAIDLLRESLFENEVSGSTTLQATVAASLAIVLDLEGHTDEAAELSARAVRLLATPLGRDSTATAPSLAIAALFNARAGRHDDAAAQRDKASKKLAEFDRSAPWFNILGLVPLVRTSLLLDDVPSALRLQHQLARQMEIQDDATPLARRVDELGITVRTAMRIFDGPSSALTAAEFRVLHYLPTNLSLADIAARLYVSRNTVKSHAAAIYRKLGTTSRTEAVDRARAGGLISDTPPTQ